MSLRTTAAWCLSPITAWYGVFTDIRNLLFALNIKRETKVSTCTVAVGNLSCGGTGKTPHAEYLLDLISQQYTTALLSRGYKRKSKGFQLDDGTHNAMLLGDEPAMIAQHHQNVIVAVCKKRRIGIQHLLKQENKPQVVVLDDAYQHRNVKPDVNILLTDYNNLFYKDHVLPFGNLRERRCNYKRANIIIITKAPQKLDPIELHSITDAIKPKSYQHIYFSSIVYQPLEPLTSAAKQIVKDNENKGDMLGLTHILVVTGVANPDPMISHIKRQSISVCQMKYADHYNFRMRDIENIRQRYEQINSDQKAILITQKDAMRLQAPEMQDAIDGLPIFVLPIKVAIHPSDYTFDDDIMRRVTESVRYHTLYQR
ncbi:MAG: tetraacyldisaccharide 4'-kinase [Bacteroidales bacterium]|nr:tetraacyldisaccharide 4'-kinase [Candidatus Colimorpha onthohippi]